MSDLLRKLPRFPTDQLSAECALCAKFRRCAFGPRALPINRWRVAIGDVAGKEAVAVLSQLRNLDSLRLYQKIGHVDADLLTRIKKTASRMNFG